MNNFNHVCVSHKMNFLSRLTKNENRENKIESLGRVDCPFSKVWWVDYKSRMLKLQNPINKVWGMVWLRYVEL